MVGSGVATGGGEVGGYNPPPTEPQMTSYLHLFLIIILKCLILCH